MSKILRVYRFDSKVLAVAVQGSVRDWAAYIGAVKGIDHSIECEEVAETGTKLPKKVAEAIFPEVLLKWRE